MMNPLVIEVLTRARELVRAGWEQGVSARDENGNVCGPLDARAATFCALGAIDRAADEVLGRPRTRGVGITADVVQLSVNAAAVLREEIEFQYGEVQVSSWNDFEARTVAEVAQAFADAIHTETFPPSRDGVGARV